MKIDLTKDEWEFLKRIMHMSIAVLETHFHEEYEQSQSFKMDQKLGSTWIDEEKGKFLQGFAFTPKDKQ